MSKVKITLDEQEYEIVVEEKGKSILQTALDNGIDAPFSCQGGVCSTCVAKLKEGKVKMDNNFILTDGEIEKGFILTCQSHPQTPEVTLTYDEKLD